MVTNMKRIFAPISIIMILVMTLSLLGIAILLLPKLPQKSVAVATDITSTLNPYPAPVVTTVTLQPTVNPLTPVPPDFWPTDQPWPPPTATIEPPQPAPAVTLFPTPEFKLLAAEVPEAELQTLWYPARPGHHATILLEQILIDANGERQEEAQTKIDLKLETRPSISQVWGLFTSQEGFMAAIIEGEGGTTKIVELSTGETINFKNPKIIITNFYNWSIDGNFFIASINNDPTSAASIVDAKTGENQKISVEDNDGVPAEIGDISYSIDGDFIADGVSYQPWYGKNNPWITEVGIRSTRDLSSRRVICTIENGKSIFPHSLKWSPDGHKLMWIGGIDTPEENGWDLWLWLADITTNNCQKIAHLGVNTGEGNFIPGGYSAGWSPDSKKIAFRFNAENEGFGLAIYDVESSQQNIIGPTSQEVLSNVQFSPDGNFIVYSVGKKDYGEIWAMRLDGKEKFPIAGPTTLNAPYQWRKNR